VSDQVQATGLVLVPGQALEGKKVHKPSKDQKAYWVQQVLGVDQGTRQVQELEPGQGTYKFQEADQVQLVVKTQGKGQALGPGQGLIQVFDLFLDQVPKPDLVSKVNLVQRSDLGQETDLEL